MFFGNLAIARNVETECGSACEEKDNELHKKLRLAAETWCALFRFTALEPVEGEVDDDTG